MTKAKDAGEKIAHTYRGPGRSPLGIPTRNLTRDEFDRLTFLQRQWVRDSDIYAPVPEREPATTPITKGGKDA